MALTNRTLAAHTAKALLLSAFLNSLVTSARGALSFSVDPGSPWPAGWYDAAVANMQTVVNMYNAYGNFGNGSIYVYYNAGIPTAQSGYGGSGGSIGVGGTYPNVRVLLHESSHWLGTGTYSAYWSGPNASALVQQFDGVGSVLSGDSQHYWPYGENYDSESSPINDARHVAMVYALRADFGIGPSTPASSVTSVSLTASDAVGESGFNYPWAWSDTHFAHPNADYTTGNFTMRTPVSGSSFIFAGNSITVNNTNGIGGGLVYNGSGTTGVISFKNLVLSGGYVRQASTAGDIFQIGGKVTLSSAPTIDAGQGPIAISANVSGSGSLTKAGAYDLTLTGTASFTGDTTISTGTLRLSPVTPVASYTFDSVSGSTVNNTGSGGTGMNGTLANGATIVPGGISGNAVSLAAGASVDISNPVTDLSNNANWTVSAWVKTSTPGSSILSKASGAWGLGNTVFYLGDGTAGGSGGIPSSVRYAGGFLQGSTGATPVTNNAWHQVTYVNNSGAYAIYVDGVSQPLSAGNSSFANADVGSIVRLGYSADPIGGDGAVNFNGLLDNVQFYSQALSSTQVSALYGAGNVSGTLPTGTNVTIGPGAVLDVNGAVQQIGSLTGGAGSSVTLGSGRLTVNSAASTAFAGVISGAGGSLVKQGAGTLTLSAVSSYGGGTTISQGSLRLASIPVSVAHRWSFNNSSLADSVGGGTATVVHLGANVAYSSTQLTLAGGASNATDYVNLGEGLLPKTNSPVTIELWATQKSVQNWSRIFDVGSGGGENLFMSWTQGTTLASDRVEWKDAVTSTANNTDQPYAIGTEYHIALVLIPQGSSTVVKWYAAPSGASSLGGARGSFTSTNTLASFMDAADNLGLSSYSGDNTANASYNEVRFWNGALSDSTLQALHTAGPDASLSSVSQALSSGQLPSTTDLSINAAGASFDLNGINQTIASLTGVQGSSILLGSGTLTVSGSASTSFAGSISGAGVLVKSGASTLTLTGSLTFTGGTSVSAGRLVTAALPPVAASGSSVFLSGGVLAVADAGTPHTLTDISIASYFSLSGGKLDLGNRDVRIVGAAGQAGVLNLAMVGPKLAPLGAGEANVYVTSAVITGPEYSAITGNTTFDGVVLGGSDLLIRYGLAGDVDGSGRISIDDYLSIDAGILGDLAGYTNGDFNHDGAVNAADYALIDWNFANQGGSLGDAKRMISLHTAEFGVAYTDALNGLQPASAPEPGSLMVLGAGVCGLFAGVKRRGHRLLGRRNVSDGNVGNFNTARRGRFVAIVIKVAAYS